MNIFGLQMKSLALMFEMSCLGVATIETSSQYVI